MAFSATKTEQQLAGAVKLQTWSIDLDSVTEGEVKTGLSQIRFAYFENEVTEGDGRTLINKSAAATTLAGSVFIDGATSNDTGHLLVIGV